MLKIRFAAVLLFVGAVISAQTDSVISVEITVIDRDLALPLDGAKIVSWDGTELLCDNNGKAVLSVPSGRAVVILVSCPGYEPGRVAVRPGVLSYTAALRIGGVLEERELVIEASRPETSKTVSGRSVAVSGRDLALQGETGIIGDVMNAVKLLPGVGYVGGYMAKPSVRGGDPNDVTAVFDGFYVENPYHWGGAFSIFDPKMVESAQLSHGVFSTRYGHTVSGLLDIRAKHPSPEFAELDLAVSSSSTNLNLSFPLGGNGGAALMGKVTYWAPFVEAAKLFVEEVRYVTTAPYISSGAFGLSYDFPSDLYMSVNGFFGSDGVGVQYDDSDASRDYLMDFSWNNKIGFLTTGLVYTPSGSTVLKGRIGAGLLQSNLDAHIFNSDKTNNELRKTDSFTVNRTVNVQGRFDLDHDLGNGFIFAAGMEERYSRWNRSMEYRGTFPQNQYGNTSGERTLDVLNHGISSSLFSLLEYKSENGRFGMELGLRGDHFLLSGDDFVLWGVPAVNPRVNFDFTVAEDSGILDRAGISFGTGLFSSINTALQNIEGRNNIDQWAGTQNRSWTSVLGTKLDFQDGYAFTLETYFKYVFSRAYTRNDRNDNPGTQHQINTTSYYFDGDALIWGFDLMLQKFYSRYWDGWISYSFIDARYRDPQSTAESRNLGDWYYPNFHRFHTLNLILNYRPVRTVNLMTRFSLASGIPMLKTVGIYQDAQTGGAPYTRVQAYSAGSRMGPVIPLDIKLSIFSFNKDGKVKREVYFSFENLLSLVYKPESPKGFDSDTGREVQGSGIASYDLPIPLITFGIKWSY